MDLAVKLVLTPQPVLSVTPLHEVDSGGPTTLTWTRDTTGASFQFSATSISGLPNPPFSAPSYNSSNNTVTVTDNHTGQSGTFNYALSVTSGATTYPASGNPSIRNR